MSTGDLLIIERRLSPWHDRDARWLDRVRAEDRAKPRRAPAPRTPHDEDDGQEHAPDLDPASATLAALVRAQARERAQDRPRSADRADRGEDRPEDGDEQDERLGDDDDRDEEPGE